MRDADLADVGLNKRPATNPGYCAECLFDFAPSVYDYFPKLEAVEDQITAFTKTVGITTTITSRLRTCCEQAALYNAGKSKAAPTASQHEFGLAFDCVPTAGLSRYGASKAEGIGWLVALAKFFGADGIAEASHAHIQWYTSEQWARFIRARDIASSIPIPGKRPK